MRDRALVVGIAGGSGAGKTTFTRHLVDRLGLDQVAILPLDAFYVDLAHLPMERRVEVNFDHPDALDEPEIAAAVDGLRAGTDVAVPLYDFSTYVRTGSTIVEHRPVVVVEGIHALTLPEVRARLDRSIYLDVPAAVRLERRVERDVAERGRDASDVRRAFIDVVAPMHDRYVAPGRELADVVADFVDAPDVAVQRAVDALGDAALVG